jgi:AcrR family transcriptional regulator
MNTLCFHYREVGVTGNRGKPGVRPETQRRVLEAAEQLFLDRGYLAVTVEDIAAAAGYTRGAVYSSFAGKEELFLLLGDLRARRQSTTVRRAVDRATSDQDKLGSIGHFLAREVKRARTWGRAELEFLAAVAGRPDLVARIVARQREERQAAADMFAALCAAIGVDVPGDREDFAVTVLALGRGLMLESLVDPAVDIGRLFAEAFTRLVSPQLTDEASQLAPAQLT